MNNSTLKTMLYIAVLLLPTAVVVCDISCQTGYNHVTCNFNRDIKEEKLNFIVWRFSFGTTEFSGQNGKQVLACNWDDREHVYKCHLKSGYTFDDKVRSGLVSVDMVNISKTHEGIYKCQLVTEEYIPFSTCNFTLNAPDIIDEKQATSPASEETLSLCTTERESTVSPVPLIVLSIAFFIIILVFVTVLCRLVRIHGTFRGVYKEIRELFTRKHDTTVLSTTDETELLTCRTSDPAATSVEYATVTKRTKPKAAEDEDLTTPLTAHTQSGKVSSEPEVPTRSTPEGTEDEDETTPFTDNTGSASQPEAPKRRTKEDSAIRSTETQTPTEHTVEVSVGHEVPKRKTTTTNAESQTTPTETKEKQTQAGAQVADQATMAKVSSEDREVQTDKVIEQRHQETMTTGWNDPAVGTQYNYKKEDVDVSQWSKEDVRDWLAKKLLEDSECGTFIHAGIDGRSILNDNNLERKSYLKDTYFLPDLVANKVKKWIKELVEENDKRRKKKQEKEKEQVASSKRRAPEPPASRSTPLTELFLPPP